MPKLPSKSEKVAYVKHQGQTRGHHCHWPGCGKQVPPAMWGCYEHWMKLPKNLRDQIWAAFRPGQEINWTPSKEYLKVAGEVQDWIAQYCDKKLEMPSRSTSQGAGAGSASSSSLSTRECVACGGSRKNSKGGLKVVYCSTIRAAELVNELVNERVNEAAVRPARKKLEL